MADSLSAAAGGRAPPVSHVIAVAIGNALAFYDFLIYSFFAVQIGHVFFPEQGEGSGLLLTFATFGAGFVMRPIGAIVIGMLGDRIGRRPAMILSFSLAGAAVVGQALTPSYAAIGVAGPILLLAFRMLLGFAIGGEVGPSTAYLVEAAPAARRGFYVSIQFATQDSAVLVAGIVGFALASTLDAQTLEAWGWRAAFLIGATIIPFGIVMRRRLAETLHEPAAAGGVAPTTPNTALVRRVAVLGFFMLASASVAAYALNYMTTYAQHTLKMATDMAFSATIATGLASVIFDLVGGWLSDKYGRKPIMILSAAVLLVSTVPAFMLLNAQPVVVVLFSVTFFLSIWNALGPAASLTAITESLPKATRSGTLAIVYAFAIAIFGGSTQFIATWLLEVTNDPLSPAYFVTGMLVVGFIAILAMHESAPRGGAG